MIIQNIKSVSKIFILYGIYWIFLLVVMPCKPGLLNFSCYFYFLNIISWHSIYMYMYLYICNKLISVNVFKILKAEFLFKSGRHLSGCHSTSNLLSCILQETHNTKSTFSKNISRFIKVKKIENHLLETEFPMHFIIFILSLSL